MNRTSCNDALHAAAVTCVRCAMMPNNRVVVLGFPEALGMGFNALVKKIKHS
jgi:hypothetical protein